MSEGRSIRRTLEAHLEEDLVEFEPRKLCEYKGRNEMRLPPALVENLDLGESREFTPWIDKKNNRVVLDFAEPEA